MMNIPGQSLKAGSVTGWVICKQHISHTFGSFKSKHSELGVSGKGFLAQTSLLLTSSEEVGAFWNLFRSY